MSGNFLPAARKLVFLGEAGCGKSEIAMQLALELAAQSRPVHFFDRYAATYLEWAMPPVRMIRSTRPSAPAARPPMARAALYSIAS